MSKILIIEDEVAIAELERDYLELSGFEVEIENTGDGGLKRALDEKFDLFILDLMLPGVDGFEICKRIRKVKNTPILMVSAKKEDIDKIRGLGLGADDYITKPFNPVTLGAKVKALIRRSRNTLSEADPIITAGPFTYNTSSLRLYKNGTEISLSAKENAMMKLFIDNVNRIFSKDMLYDMIWGEAVIDENAIMVYISRLRQKIEDNPAVPKYIQNVRGIGYRFVV